jgi:hypothetical protein
MLLAISREAVDMATALTPVLLAAFGIVHYVLQARVAAKVEATKQKAEEAATKVQEVKEALEANDNKTHSKLDTLQQQTNGHMTALMNKISSLEAALASSQQQTKDAKDHKDDT